VWEVSVLSAQVSLDLTEIARSTVAHVPLQSWITDPKIGCFSRGEEISCSRPKLIRDAANTSLLDDATHARVDGLIHALRREEPLHEATD
jgi:hypothetical protein